MFYVASSRPHATLCESDRRVNCSASRMCANTVQFQLSLLASERCPAESTREVYCIPSCSKAESKSHNGPSRFHSVMAAI